ncbi:unnamed protein product, partial [Acanthoscelides obtectus]
KRNRLHWVHPINERREETGLFHTLFEDLRNDEKKFFNYFRMSMASFDELHDKLKNVLRRQNTKMRNCIQPIEMWAVTLRYLASSCTFTDLHYTYRIGISTASKIVKEVCKAICAVLQVESIPSPTREIWESIASDFETIANFPHCIGAVDGKHVRLTCPFRSGSMYFNYKDYYSVVLMAVADSKYRFVFVNVGSYGKDCDSSTFKRSSLWQSIESNTQPLPEDKCLPGTKSPKLPYWHLDYIAIYYDLLGEHI